MLTVIRDADWAIVWDPGQGAHAYAANPEEVYAFYGIRVNHRIALFAS